MSRTHFTVPRLLLSGEALLGITRHPREHTLEVKRRYDNGAALAAALSLALDRGADGVLFTPSATVREALGGLSRRVPTWAVVPNVPQFARDSAELGLPGAALKRLRGASPITFARIGLTGAGHVLEVLKNDIGGMAPVLIELEIASLGARDLHGVVMASTLTDLALAARHRRFFSHVVDFVRSRFGVQAGFETHNPGWLLGALREWDVRPDLVVGPLNPMGFMMKPDPARTLREIAAARFPLVAKELTAGGANPLAVGAAYARAHGAQGLAIDLADLDPDMGGLTALGEAGG
ncbi:MAG TPA: hypothetical protein VMJ70_13170 [Candidatus Sulfotelmatobacter sp.]|nr:hypothetical protein [Candidatus Sulfotelmatobacter sp.]